MQTNNAKNKTCELDVAGELSKMPFFGYLPVNVLEQLAGLIKVARYKKDSLIVKEGESGDQVYIIASGLVKISKDSSREEETVLKTAGLGEIFGEMAILDGLSRSADVVAAEDTLLFSLERENFLRFLKTNPEASLKLLQTMSLKLRRTNEIVLEHRRMAERLRYLGQYDPLTGLYNRSFFQEEMKRYGEKQPGPVGLIVCDVDGLKLVNDTLGHDAGDALLVEAARVIKKCFREGDVMARIGGDEFAVLLPNSSKKVAEECCRRIEETVAGYNRSGPAIPLSISVGFSIREDCSIPMNDLFKDADTNMYRQKLYSSQSARGAIVRSLIKTVQARDFITDEHARLRALVALFGKVCNLSGRSLSELDLLARFQDIGNIGVLDQILFKQEPLTIEETKEMQRHCEVGYRIALSAPNLAPIADLILKHHEWWNGQGYPLGLKGEEIPLECRLLAIADAYDAMTSDRPYRQALTHEKALAELKRCAGARFDPGLVEKFINLDIEHLRI